MKLQEYIRLGECAICSYSDKKQEKKLRCNWSDKKSELCNKIKKCGNFPEMRGDISNIEI